MECILQATKYFEICEGKNSIKITTVLHIYITFDSRSLAKKNFFLRLINATTHTKHESDLNNITIHKHNTIIICDMSVNCDVMMLFRLIILYLICVWMSLQSV